MSRRVVTSPPRTVPPGQMRQVLLRVRRFRLDFLFGSLLLLFVLLLARLGKLQLVDAAQFRAEADRKHSGAYRFQPRRGRILDRNGRVLAAPRAARRVGLDPSEIKDPRAFALLLSDSLGGTPPPWKIREVLAAARAWANRNNRPLPRYRVLLPHVDDPALVDRIDEVAALPPREMRKRGIYGVVVDREEGRSYPNGDYAAHVVGQVPRGEDAAGTGCEQAFHEVLSGEATEVPLYRDGRRRPYARAGAVDRSASLGHDVTLTLDITIQHFLESALSDLTERWKPLQACGVVLDPHSGEILALANRPTFDPNQEPANANLAVQGLYEPGSFFKPFTVAWALRYAVVDPYEVLDMPESIRLAGDPHPVRDTHYVGPGDIRLLLSASSNTGAASLAHRLGRERMRALFEHLFPDRPGGTRCGLPFEKSGGPHVARWPWWRAHRAGFGQGFHITPMQMITAFAAFARDDGCAVRPTISLDGRRGPVAGTCVCDPLHLPVVREGLAGCVREGTARAAFAGCRWSAAAKTATAQQRGHVDGHPADLLNCSLAAYAPAQDPQVVVLVLAQLPAAPGAYGGTVAAPYVREVIERTLAHWKLPIGGPPAEGSR